MMRKRFIIICAVIAMVVCISAHAQTDRARELVSDAQNAIERGQPAAAVDDLKAALQTSPDWPAAHSRLAVAYQMMDMDAAALQQYLRLQRMADTMEGTISGPGSSPLGRQLITQCEAYMTLLLNDMRATKGMTLLYPLPKMVSPARGHSREMRDEGYFSHTSPNEETKTVGDRFGSVFGFQPRCIAENLARRWRSGQGISLSLAHIAESQADLLESPGHRENILREEVTHVAIGIAINEEGDYWVTQMFADLTDHQNY